ncbi:HDIG domain-containing metalloprotein [Actinoplanes sp. NPDC049599]|uniref:HDIG domain-containing metalloprotein n=1 Tax=Actinoplanes sp. NPDC049599 TaxID=3363903 RepID=UPI00379D763F
MTSRLSTLPGAAEELAYELLAPLGNRWRHTVGVAARAAELAALLDVDRDVLVAAAWVHDIGYAEAARVTGFHPLDGARHLDRLSWPAPIVGLVAHHSGARFIAAARGLAEALAACPDAAGPISDALTYADQTVGPDGCRVTPAERYEEMLRRHGPASWNAVVDPVRRPHLLAVAARVERRLGHRAAFTNFS